MKFPKVFNLKSAAHNRVPFDLSSRTVTTGEFYQFTPVKMIECVPGDKFNIDMTVFTRTAALKVPSFDRAVIQSRAFFVPSRLCYPYFNEFITGEKIAIGSSSYTPTLPLISSGVLTEWFAAGHLGGHALSTTAPIDIENPDSIPVHDFSITNPDTVPVSRAYRNLTYWGRQALKIFQGLGYRWNWQTRFEAQDDQAMDVTVTFSALPLLAFLRIYLDWFVPSQLQAAHPIAQYLNSLKTGSTAGEMTQAQIENLFSSLAPAYDEDYFTAAWLYPNEVGGDTNRIVPSTLRDYGANIGGAVQSDSVGTYVDSMSTSLLRTNYGTLERVSQYALNLLEGMANYVTRNNYAGSRAVEQILARFGVRVPDTRLQRCEFIGADDTDVQFAEVTAMADSGDYKVGQFAGKGVALGSDGNWTIECKEYGYIVIVSTIVPKISYVQGFDRHVIHRNRFDFYTPEFDCVGPQAIAAGELYCQSNDSEADPFDDLVAGNGHPTDVFGYCPRFAEYKTSKDSLLGDFNIPHLNAGLDSFYFSRLLKPNGAFPLKAQGPFLFADGRQYNRIFNVKDQDTDHFYMWYKFDIKAMRPMRSISDSIPLDGDGEKIAQQPNGVHLS